MSKETTISNEKKVGIISIHYGVNFGSALQAYALFWFISTRYKCNVEIINYIPPRYRFSRLYKLSISSGINHTLHELVRNVRYYYVDSKYKRYLSKLARISPIIHSTNEAEQRYKNFDYLVAGSDQIWNSDYNEGVDSMYYLSFASNKTRKIAYAASAGKTEFSNDEWEMQKKLLKDFYKLSYREGNMLALMESHGIMGGQLVLDPTYLLASNEWIKLGTKPQRCPLNYLLMYFLDTDSQEIIECAHSIAEKKGLQTVLICNGRKKRIKNVDYVAANLTPDYYIWLFSNAKYVVTNSFHGVSFSINLEKQFSVLRRDKYNSRLDSILELMELTNRYITVKNYKNAFVDIDYDNVTSKKEYLKKQSIAFLDETFL